MNDSTHSTIHATGQPAQWREVLKAQGRSLVWLARETGTPIRRVRSYAAWKPGMSRTDYGRRPKDRWIEKVGQALGEEVTR